MFLRVRPEPPGHDAVAEVRLPASEKHGWTVERDIKACFDEISPIALMDGGPEC